MAKRGRPPHPDILTPREWQVLDLLRERLSNEQIARRLEITERTAKWHVAEILSKLAVGSREEAAAWQRGRRWPLAAFAPLLFWRKLGWGWLPATAGGVAIVAVAAGLGLLAWGLVRTEGEGDGGTPGSIEALTLEDVYTRLRAAVTRDGQVLHTVRFSQNVLIFGDEIRETTTTDEIWLDASRGLVRQALDGREGDTILQGSVRYSQDDIGRPGFRPPGGLSYMSPASRCHDRFDFDLAALIACQGFLQESESFVNVGAEYAGEAAIDITTTGTEVSDWTFDVTEHVYLDPETFLPLATVSERVARGDGAAPNWRFVITFEHEFVALDSLAADFFELFSIGVGGIDPMWGLKQNDPGIAVYWLGLDLPAEAGRPGLMLQNGSASSREAPNGPERRATMIYDDARQFGHNLVWLDEWDPAEWDAYVQDLLDPTPRPGRGIPGEGLWWDWPCTERSEESFSGGRATIFFRVSPPGLSDYPLTPGPCLAGEPDQFRAHVYLDETLVIITSVPVDENPYANLEGFQQIVRGLVEFVQ